jgi:hypothetical protein
MVMKTYLIAGLVGALLGSLTYAPARKSDVQGDVEIFYGVLSELDSQPIPTGSRLSISVLSSSERDRPTSYRLYLDCDDWGAELLPLNGVETDRAWRSFAGSAGPRYTEFVRCPDADPARYNRIVAIMGGGGDVELADHTFRLFSDAGEARFHY